MNVIIAVLVAGLSINHLTELIRHGSIFEGMRKWLDARIEHKGCVGFTARAVSCGFCFSHWVTVPVVFGCFWVHNVWFKEAWTWSPMWLVVASASVRVAQLINDATYQFNRMHDFELPDMELSDGDGFTEEDTSDVGTTSE
jgi:hypothetical protein